MKTDNKPIYKKILNIMEAINSIKKDGYNEHNKYSYATEVGIKTAVRKELIKNKLIFKHEVVEARTRGDIIQNKVNVLVSIKVKYTFTDVETGDTYSGEYYGHGADTSDKGLYKAITGSIKYILTSTFLIPTGDDPEENSKEAEPFKGNEFKKTAEKIKIPGNYALPASERLDTIMSSTVLSDMEKLKHILNGMGGNTESSALLLLKDRTGLAFKKFKDIPKTKIATALTKLTKK